MLKAYGASHQSPLKSSFDNEFKSSLEKPRSIACSSASKSFVCPSSLTGFGTTLITGQRIGFREKPILASMESLTLNITIGGMRQGRPSCFASSSV